MTLKEIENPDTIDSKRISRIAKGSGSSPGEIKEMLSQYTIVKQLASKGKGMDLESMKNPQDLMKSMGAKQLRKLAKKFKGKLPM